MANTPHKGFKYTYAQPRMNVADRRFCQIDGVHSTHMTSCLCKLETHNSINRQNIHMYKL